MAPSQTSLGQCPQARGHEGREGVDTRNPGFLPPWAPTRLSSRASPQRTKRSGLQDACRSARPAARGANTAVIVGFMELHTPGLLKAVVPKRDLVLSARRDLVSRNTSAGWHVLLRAHTRAVRLPLCQPGRFFERGLSRVLLDSVTASLENAIFLFSSCLFLGSLLSLLRLLGPSTTGGFHNQLIPHMWLQRL